MVNSALAEKLSKGASLPPAAPLVGGFASGAIFDVLDLLYRGHRVSAML